MHTVSLSLFAWQSIGDLEFESERVSQASLSLFFILFPHVSLFLFVYNSLSPSYTLFHPSDVMKMKYFYGFDRLL